MGRIWVCGVSASARIGIARVGKGGTDQLRLAFLVVHSRPGADDAGRAADFADLHALGAAEANWLDGESDV